MKRAGIKLRSSLNITIPQISYRQVKKSHECSPRSRDIHEGEVSLALMNQSRDISECSNGYFLFFRGSVYTKKQFSLQSLAIQQFSRSVQSLECKLLYWHLGTDFVVNMIFCSTSFNKVSLRNYRECDYLSQVCDTLSISYESLTY